MGAVLAAPLADTPSSLDGFAGTGAVVRTETNRSRKRRPVDNVAAAAAALVSIAAAFAIEPHIVAAVAVARCPLSPAVLVY